MMSDETARYSDEFYPFHSIDFLVRARECLERGGRQDIVYAALELRLGIEMRLQEYADAAEVYTRKKANGWKVVHTRLDLERVFKTAEKCVLIQFGEEWGGPVVLNLLFTPVTERLTKMHACLGNVLHIGPSPRHQSDEWWWETFGQVTSTFQALRFACSGTLLHPPISRKTDDGGMMVDMGINIHKRHPRQDISLLEKRVGGDVINVAVRIVDAVPQQLLVDV